MLLFAFSLSACGFRLAGSSSSQASFESLRLVTSHFSKQQRQLLENQLERAGIRVIDNGELQVLAVRFKPIPDRLLATSASGKSLQQMTRQLSFSLKSSSGEILLESKMLRRQRDFELDSNQLLSSVAEQASVAENLEADLYDQLIQSLNRI